MVKNVKRITGAAAILVPLLWVDESWNVRVSVLPEVTNSFSSPVLSVSRRRKKAAVFNLHRPGLPGRGRHRFGRARVAGECARFAGAAVSLPARRTREQAPRTLLQGWSSRTGFHLHKPRLGRALAGHRGALLAMAALPLGGAPALNLNIRHVFENNTIYSL